MLLLLAVAAAVLAGMWQVQQGVRGVQVAVWAVEGAEPGKQLAGCALTGKLTWVLL